MPIEKNTLSVLVFKITEKYYEYNFNLSLNQKYMNTSQAHKDLQGVRTLCVGCPKLIIEDWMKEIINKSKTKKKG